MKDEIFAEFNSSFKFDRRIFAADVRVSVAYCGALFNAGVFTRSESERVKNGLQAILKRADYDKNYFSELSSENIHSFIETRLIQLIGEAGGKLRAGRSRLDQAATAFRLWLREEIKEISGFTRDLQNALIGAAEKQSEAVLPGYTNLRRTQPILWAHWCLAHFEMLARDRERLDEVWRRVNVLPLGAANLAGTAFEIDCEAVARELNFEGVAANSLDAVSDNDFALEFVGACSLLMVHLSRLAEDLILYASAEFGFIKLGDAVSIGSSLIAPEQHTIALALVRGKAGRIFGHQTALLSTMKGLPLAYNKDSEEDKEAVFDTVDSVLICLRTAKAVLENLRVNVEKTRAAATRGYLNAAELADYLVQRDTPIKAAQETVGKILRYAVAEKKELNELSWAELREFSDVFGKDVFENLTLEQTLASKNQIGGTAPERVSEALEAAKSALAREL